MSLFGDWSTIRERIILITGFVRKDMQFELKNLGELYVKMVKEHIDKQDLSLKELSPVTQAMKKEHKTDWWIESGQFKDGLKVETKGGFFNFSVQAGALSSVKYTMKTPVSGVSSMYDIGIRLERGWNRIPARPLFSLTNREFNANLKKFGANTMRKAQIVWGSK